ncbi:hypothetical protein [Priestia megaterium]|uniref:hypothetical protein n=1 Tax=Priestia megaterium TaxID=1404 RepID=UPI001C52B729|nr:hypothetical protein [Priestia megaterium]MBW0933527.1 hypothetical protein [Priestia megaterium]
MTLANKVCEQYTQAIRNEIYNYYTFQKPVIMHEMGKVQIKDSSNTWNQTFGVKGSNLLDYFKTRDDVEMKQNLTYLSTLLETFMMDFISDKEKDSNSSDLRKDINDNLKNNHRFEKPHNQSLLRTDYSIAIMEDHFNYTIRSLIVSDSLADNGIESDLQITENIENEQELDASLKKHAPVIKDNKISDLFYEFGELRKLLVHYNGDISNVPVSNRDNFRERLKKHIKKGHIVNDKVRLTIPLLMEHVISVHNFIWQCSH